MRHNMSQKDLAEKTGLSGTLISDVVRGRTPLSCRIAYLLGGLFDSLEKDLTPWRTSLMMAHIKDLSQTKLNDLAQYALNVEEQNK